VRRNTIITLIIDLIALTTLVGCASTAAPKIGMEYNVQLGPPGFNYNGTLVAMDRNWLVLDAPSVPEKGDPVRIWISREAVQFLMVRAAPVTPLPATSNADAEHVQILHSRLSTSNAANDISQCLRGFNISSGINGLDIFSGRLQATTNDGYKISVTFRWNPGGDTEITFESNLEKPQYDYVLAAVEKAIANDETHEPAAPAVSP
jgi:hypothetical protein